MMSSVMNKINFYSIQEVVIGDLSVELGHGEKVERIPWQTCERNGGGNRMAAMVEANKLFVSNNYFQKKAGRDRLGLRGLHKRPLIDARRILLVLSFNTGSDLRMLRTRIHIFLAAEKKVPNVSGRLKKVQVMKGWCKLR